MSTVILVVGFIGFGKTTVARQFEQWGYKKYTHDEYMVNMFGDHQNNEDFVKNYNKVSEVIFTQVKHDLLDNKDIIIDFGLWSKQNRKDMVNLIESWNIPVNIMFLNIICDMEIARQRCISRENNWKSGELWVPVSVFDMKRHEYEPISESEFSYPILTVKN